MEWSEREHGSNRLQVVRAWPTEATMVERR
jgi:hypothetical protein